MSHRNDTKLLALPALSLVLSHHSFAMDCLPWAKSEVNNQLRTFAQLALDKSELVIRRRFSERCS